MSAATPTPVRDPHYHHGRGKLPTGAELEAVDKIVDDAYNALEQLIWQLQKIEAAWTGKGEAPAKTPTLAQIGALHVFSSNMKGRGEDIAKEAGKVAEFIWTLEEMRSSVDLDRPAESGHYGS